MDAFARVGRDLCLIGVGVLTGLVTPPSVQESGLNGVLGFVWALMIGLGAIASLAGVLMHHFASEVIGCSFVGGGFAIWAFASINQPMPTTTSYAIALVFAAGSFGQLLRIAALRQGRFTP